MGRPSSSAPHDNEPRPGAARSASTTDPSRVPGIGGFAALYALAGAAALVHEVAWTRVGSTLLGGDARALAATLVAVLGGMGLGALLAPFVARRWGALRGFGIVEGGAALCSAALPWVAIALDSVVGLAFRTFGTGPAFTVTSVVIATVLFAVPSLAMGAGLPLLAQARAGADQTPRDSGTLYAAHALGGALGGLAAAFVLLPLLGVTASVWLASTMQLAVVAVVGVKARRAPPCEEGRAREATRARPGPAGVVVWLLFASMIAGIATSTLQTLWTRVATLAVGPSVQGFAIVAGVYVLALAAGAGIAAPFARSARSPAAVYAALALAAGVVALVGLPTVGGWPAAAQEVAAQQAAAHQASWLDPAADGARGVSWWLALEVAWPMFIPVALAAATFPFGVAVLRCGSPRAAARDVGWLVAAGAIGNVVGVLCATFWLAPALGLAGALGAGGLLLGLAGMTAAVSGLRGGPGRVPLRARHAVLLGALVVGLIGMAALSPRRFDPDALTRSALRDVDASRLDHGALLFAHHGVDSTVTVRRRGDERILQVDGRIEATVHDASPADGATADGATADGATADGAKEVLTGLLPPLLADSPSQALVIGFGTGVSVDAVSTVQSIRRVEVAELVDGVLYAAPHFARWNRRVLDDPRVVPRSVDGALLLRHGERRYDVIVLAPWNARANEDTERVSASAHETARDRLTEGGVAALPVDVRGTSPDRRRGFVATFTTVFPNATLWELSRGEHYLLIGKRGPESDRALDLLAHRLRDDRVAQQLARAGVNGADGLWGRLVDADPDWRSTPSGATGGSFPMPTGVASLDSAPGRAPGAAP